MVKRMGEKLMNLKTLGSMVALFVTLAGCNLPDEGSVDSSVGEVAIEKDVVGPDEACEWIGCPKEINVICPDDTAPTCSYANNTLAIGALLGQATTYGLVCKHPADDSSVSYVDIDTPTTRKRYYYYKGKLVAFLRVDKLAADPSCGWGDTRYFYGKLPFWCCP